MANERTYNYVELLNKLYDPVTKSLMITPRDIVPHDTMTSEEIWNAIYDEDLKLIRLT